MFWSQIKKNKNLALIIFLPLVLSGCLINVKTNNTSQSAKEALGSFFVSDDNGKSWTQRNNLYTSDGKSANFGAANITTMAFDPQDTNAIWLGTQTNGVYYTYNIGKGWFNTLANQGRVNGIVVSPRDKCTVLVAIHNKIWKTEDCARTWDTVYFESRENQFIRSININYDNPDLVYAGTNGGSLLVSRDEGLSWEVIYRFDDDILEILVLNHNDSNIVYAATKSKGIFKSIDAGLTWEDLMKLDAYEIDDSQPQNKEGVYTAIKLKEEPKEFGRLKGTKLFTAIDIDRSVPDSLIYANDLGIFRLLDNRWEQINLLTPDKRERKNALAVNPLNGQDIYYGTNNAFYHTVDGGINWEISELPVKRATNSIEISPDNKYIYLGLFTINQ